MGRLDKKVVTRILVALFVVILVGGVLHAVSIDVFNKTVHSVSGADETQQTYLKFNNRSDSTSKWVKRDYKLYDKTVDLQAQTVDGTLVNNSSDTVKSWGMTINIEHDCFVNNAWVGTVEIHQFLGTESEATQTLDLRNYDLGEVKLTYFYDGDLLIPLKQGDYIVYYPSEQDEFNVAPHSELTMGMIFYYLDELDLSNYTIDYQYHRDMTYGMDFIVLAVLAIVWVLLLAGWLVSDASYKRAKRELDLRKSSLASMSSVYSIISFIDLKKDELIPVFANAKTKEALPQGSDARKKLLGIFARDTTGVHRKAVLEFVDTETLPSRLERDTIALEYVSEAFGWSEVRFFAVDRDKGMPLERVLLTIRDINDEKKQLERFETHAAQVELENSTRNAFVFGASNSMRVPVGDIDALADMILGETDDGSIQSYAKQIKTRSKLLTYLIDGAVDLSQSGISDTQASFEEYSLPSTVEDACEIANAVVPDEKCALETEISPSIPERLVGDPHKLEQVLVGLLGYATRRTGSKNVRVAAYGTVRGDDAHILFSIKTDRSNLTDDDVRALSEFIGNVEQYGVYAVDSELQELEGIALLITLMGSRLNVVNDAEEGMEFYFEIEQQIVAGPPGGK